MPRPLFRLVPLALSLSLVLTACGGDAPAQQGSTQAVPVSVVTLKSEDVTLIRELPGRTTPSLIAEVRPQVSGIVRRRLFTEGGEVRAGEPLYQLDDAAYRADSNAARASLARAQAALVTARLNAGRSAELVKIDAIARQDNDNAQAQLRQAEADVKAAQAVVDGTGVTLDYARITSPISGRIGKSSVTQGALVSAGQATPLATVQQLDPIYVDLTQSSAELLALRKGLATGALGNTDSLPVTVLLEDGSAHAHEGKLAFSEVTVDPSTGSFALRVVVPNPDGVLLPGMYVRAVVGNGERKDAILVPQQGVTRDPKGNTSALVVGKDGKAETRPVKVSRAIGDRWLVEDGLKAGDRVIVEGLQKIKPGAPLVASEAGTPAPARTAANPFSKPAAGAGSK
ncbi:hemolysin D [Lysobacter daejeonensis GH1-9]|uniref:Hemolysin D n=1 Tax=Lysobacter daejeonensis GH1-9 TaxID=1385517 RepID=A0A0A0EWE5_9GAMM|nr:efflux RND transporter periplasmic adaptor subunit [Lysobacter daejeonensis]KGM54358.1 hemolysin D [Lysobacter daejeonensis GH1-9]